MPAVFDFDGITTVQQQRLCGTRCRQILPGIVISSVVGVTGVVKWALCTPAYDDAIDDVLVNISISE